MSVADPAKRADVASAAMSWLGTPYKHHARIKGPQGGVDCAQLLAAVAQEAGITGYIDLGDYPRLFHMSHAEERFINWLSRFGCTQVEAPGVGDFGVWKYGLSYSHGGVVVEAGDDPLIVHSYIRAQRGVMLTRVSEAPLTMAEGVTWWSVFA